jgi:soluble lytic murein transglycosylase-like protein
MTEIGQELGVDPLLLEAISFRESTWRADAFRFEPGFYDRYMKGKPEWAGQIPRRVSSSYGLMQVMYPVAREHGFPGDPEGLFAPETNLQVGCQVLLKLFTWADGDIPKALAAYNGGKGNWTAPVPQEYSRRVMKHYEALRGA